MVRIRFGDIIHHRNEARMGKEERDYSEIIFGYMCIPAYGFFGESDGGFSIVLYPDGKLIYKTYIFEQIEKDKKEVFISKETVERIKAVLCAHQSDIDGFREHTYNGSFDGEENLFIFSGKEFTTWNITYRGEDEREANNPGYYKKYMSVFEQQNRMLDIFTKITEILATQGILLNINKIIFHKKFKNRILLNIKKMFFLKFKK